MIDIRSLVPMDHDTIISSVKKTGRIVTIHEAHEEMSFAAEIVSKISEEALMYLDAPPERVGAKMCTLPFNVGLENAVVPQEDDIKEAILRTLHR